MFRPGCILRSFARCWLRASTFWADLDRWSQTTWYICEASDRKLAAEHQTQTEEMGCETYVSRNLSRMRSTSSTVLTERIFSCHHSSPFISALDWFSDIVCWPKGTTLYGVAVADLEGMPAVFNHIHHQVMPVGSHSHTKHTHKHDALVLRKLLAKHRTAQRL